MSDEKPSLPDLARQVVVNFGAGLVAVYAGPMAGAAAQGTTPAVLAGMDWISASIGKRRIEHATETMTDAAEEFGARTPEEFIKFLEAALSDEEHQELLARALTIAQDTASRDKRRALGRALAAAASDTGTKVNRELLLIRILADLDEPHIRCLRIVGVPRRLSDAQQREDEQAAQRFHLTVKHYQDLRLHFRQEAEVRLSPHGWSANDVGMADDGLRDVADQLLGDLERLRLVSGNGDERSNVLPGHVVKYLPTHEGRKVLNWLREPDTPR